MPLASEHQVSNDQQAPFVADDFEREIDRAKRSVISRHGLAPKDCLHFRTSASMLQLVVFCKRLLSSSLRRGHMKRVTGTEVYAVVGATGDVGKVVVERLMAAGHLVRPVSRSAGVSLDDRAALQRAFAGVDGAFLMIPFDVQAADLHERERDVGAKLADAVKGSAVRRVVLLSGLSAPLKTGSSLGAALMEDRLDSLGIAELVHLRAGFFMENFRKGLAFVAQAATGCFSTPFRGDLPMPMIAARDVGARAAELLIEEPFRRLRVQELRGGGEYTMAEATAILGAAIGRQDLKYAQAPPEVARTGMLGAGMSPSFADAVLETARSFNQEEQWGLETRSAQSTTPTTLERWAKDVLAEGQPA
jgi:uncharacterized protein YbjT (DUF2867 family)